jgi:hypothetical protein
MQIVFSVMRQKNEKHSNLFCACAMVWLKNHDVDCCSLIIMIAGVSVEKKKN